MEDTPVPASGPTKAPIHTPEPKSNPVPKLDPTAAPLLKSNSKPELTAGPEITPVPSPISRCCPRLSSTAGASWPSLALISEESWGRRESRGLVENSSKSSESKIYRDRNSEVSGTGYYYTFFSLLLVTKSNFICDESLYEG